MAGRTALNAQAKGACYFLTAWSSTRSVQSVERRLTRRGRARRDQLVDFAARRFAENGYHATSVTDIVNGLGVGKGI